MMKNRGPIVAFALFSVALALTAGCEDEGARQRAALQSEINAASAKLERARYAESPAEARDLLNSIASSLSNTGDAEPGQAAAAAFLVASATQELGTILLGEAEAVESELRDQREVIRAELSGAARLAAIAEVHGEFNVAGPKSLLNDERSSVQSRMQDFQQRVAELNKPISERESLNAEDSEEVSRLRMEANDLRRQANEVGHAAGFETYLQAVHLDRRIDTYEIEIAHRESDLRFDLRPEHDLAQRNVGHLQSLMHEITATEQMLEARSNLNESELRATRAVIDDLRRHARTSSDAIVSRMNGELNDLYTQAGQSFEQAARQASRSGQGGPPHRVAALVAQARAREAASRLHWSRARGLHDQAAVLAELGQDAGQIQGLAKTELEASIDALSEAHEMLAQVGTSEPAISEFKNNVQRGLATLRGEEMQIQPVAATHTSLSTTSRLGLGADSPEEIVAAVIEANEIYEVPMLLDYFAPFDTIPGINRNTRRSMEHIVSMVSDMAVFEAALQKQFGRGIEELSSASDNEMSPLNVPMLTSAELIEQDDDSALMKVTYEDGSWHNNHLLKLDGRWYLRPDFGPVQSVIDLYTRRTGLPMESVTLIVSEMLAEFGREMKNMSARVAANEFATFDDVRTAVDQAAEQLGTEMGQRIAAQFTPPSK